jgi:hypothetical protein
VLQKIIHEGMKKERMKGLREGVKSPHHSLGCASKILFFIHLISPPLPSLPLRSEISNTKLNRPVSSSLLSPPLLYLILKHNLRSGERKKHPNPISN